MKITMIALQTVNAMLAKDSDDDLKWGGSADKQYFAKLSKQIGTIVMGSGTFESMGQRVLPDRQTIVLTSKPDRYKHIVDSQFAASDETPESLVRRLESDGAKELAVIGGSKVYTAFLTAGLIDIIDLSIAPILFSEGVSLLSITGIHEVHLELIEHKLLDKDTINLRYKVIKD